MRELSESDLEEFFSAVLGRDRAWVRDNWDLTAAVAAAAAIRDGPEAQRLGRAPEPEDEAEEQPEKALGRDWLSVLIERLSRERGWTPEQILALPYLGLDRIMSHSDRAAFDAHRLQVTAVWDGAMRAIGAAFTGREMPDLPEYEAPKADDLSWMSPTSRALLRGGRDEDA